jgi:TolB protein
VAWLVEKRPADAARLAPDGKLVFTKDSAPQINPLVRAWRAAQPCRLYHPSFGPSGERIVFSSDCEGPWGVYVMNADGTMPRRLTERGMEARMPRWSPDGASVVFQSNRAGHWDVYSIAANGTGLRRLTDDPAADTSPAFSPDGTRVLFASDRAGSNELYVMPTAGGPATPITRDRSVGFRPAWAPDGSHVLFRASSPPRREDGAPGQFFRVRPDGAEAGVVGGGPRREFNPSYAPDGARIAFDAHRHGAWDSDDGLWEIWVMNADGSERRMLTSDSVNDWGPAWSPDGRSILFLSGRDNVYDIFLMASDGSNRRRLTRWTDR